MGNAPNKEYIIDFTELERLFSKKKERSANFRTSISGGVVKLLPYNIEEGKIASVSLPLQGDAIHTHPLGCASIDNCSLLPPSAQDMKVFAERGTRQIVISRGYNYVIRCKLIYDLADTDAVCRYIFDYFTVIEDYFDNFKGNKDILPMDLYHTVWLAACTYCDWFELNIFKNNL